MKDQVEELSRLGLKAFGSVCFALPKVSHQSKRVAQSIALHMIPNFPFPPPVSRCVALPHCGDLSQATLKTVKSGGTTDWCIFLCSLAFKIKIADQVKTLHKK